MRRTGLACIVIVALLAACTSDGSGGSTTSGETPTTQGQQPTTTGSSAPTTSSAYSFGIVEPFSIDPALTVDLYGAHVVRVLFDGLTDIAPDLSVVPAVAESWDTDDNITWTFHLRDDVTFSNGRQVVAGDFVYAWNRAASADTASPVAYQGLPIAGWGEVMDGAAETITGVTAVDDQTLEVVTSDSFALLPKILAHGIFSPVPQEAVDADPEGFADQPVGNGPYVLAGPWEHNVRIPLVKNTTYYGEPGVVDEIEVKLYSDTDTMFRDVQGENLDVAFQSVSPGLISTARSEFADRLLEVATGSVGYIQTPTTVAPYDNADLRRALSMALDREAMAERIWSGTVTPATGLVPPQAAGAVSDGCPACTLDPEGAVELYQASGGLPGDATKIYFEPSFNGDDAEAIANSWRSVLGVETELVAMEFDPLIELMYEGVTDGMVIIGWIWDYPSAYSFLSPLLESTSGDNTGFWSNAEFDAALASARTAASEEEGIPFLEEAQRIFGDQLPLIPLYFTNDLSVYSERVANVIQTAHGFIYLEDIEVVG
jgi:ABC-type oligopeptide transport system substrate-binding subunit